MSTAIRLTRMGRKKRPFYRLVAIDSRKRRDGAYLANLGYYNPFVEPYEVKLHEQEILAWLKKGAQVSETARALLRGQGILYRWSLVKQGLAAEEVEAKMAEWQAGADKRVAEFARKRDEAAKVAAAAEAKAAAEKAEAEKAEAEAQAAAEAGEEAAEETAADEAPAAEEAAPEEAAAEEAPAEEAPAAEAPAEEPAAEAEPEKKEEG